MKQILRPIGRWFRLLRHLFRRLLRRIKHWLSLLSFKTGLIVLALCIPFYILSFAQMALPLSAATKSALWVILFGLAKTFQYGGLTILGAEGVKRLKRFFRRGKEDAAQRIKNGDAQVLNVKDD